MAALVRRAAGFVPTSVEELSCRTYAFTRELVQSSSVSSSSPRPASTPTTRPSPATATAMARFSPKSPAGSTPTPANYSRSRWSLIDRVTAPAGIAAKSLTARPGS